MDACHTAETTGVIPLAYAQREAEMRGMAMWLLAGGNHACGAGEHCSVHRVPGDLWACQACHAVWCERPDCRPVDECEASLRLRFQELEMALRSAVPEGRELVLALTRLEECARLAVHGRSVNARRTRNVETTARP